MPMLSKTRFMHGCQCLLRLWNESHRPDLATDPDPATQAILKQGTEVGELARERYPGGQLVEADHRILGTALRETAALIRNPAVHRLFEAAFVHSDVLVRADVLKREGDHPWDLIEVKCSSRCQPVYEADVALQAWVLKGAGIPVRKAGVLTLDTTYVYDGQNLRLDKLFRFHDRTELANELKDGIAAQVEEQLAILKKEEPPEVTPGCQCFEPYPCPFYEHCTRDLVQPEYPVSELPRIRPALVRALAEEGFESILDLPATLPLTPMQARVRDCVVNQRAWVSKGLRQALGAFTRPVHYLDFETYNPAIPKYRGMRPFQRVPFQWSCHHEDGEGGFYHSEFLAEDGGDPREPFVRSLLDALGDEGSICVYSGFEASVIRELAEQFPERAEPLLALAGRLVDLLHVVRTHYYHPEFHGSYSIKRVLPALVPGMDYEALAIGKGDMASLSFQKLLASEDPAVRARLGQDLLTYCRMDTLAMVRVRQALEDLAGA